MADPKQADFVIRSVVTAIIAIALMGAIIISVLLGRDLDSASGTVLISAASIVLGFYFGNHAAINGNMMLNSQLNDAAIRTRNSISTAEADTATAVAAVNPQPPVLP